MCVNGEQELRLSDSVICCIFIPCQGVGFPLDPALYGLCKYLSNQKSQSLEPFVNGEQIPTVAHYRY